MIAVAVAATCAAGALFATRRIIHIRAATAGRIPFRISCNVTRHTLAAVTAFDRYVAVGIFTRTTGAAAAAAHKSTRDTIATLVPLGAFATVLTRTRTRTATAGRTRLTIAVRTTAATTKGCINNFNTIRFERRISAVFTRFFVCRATLTACTNANRILD